MKKNIFLTTTIISILLTGCNDFLAETPDNRAILDSKEKIAELLVTAYPQGNYIPFCEAMSDNVEDNPSTSQDVRNSDPYFWRDVSATAQDTPENYWNTCYAAIAASNHALEAIRQFPDTTLFNDERGEALVTRAYAHFMLVSLFSKTYNSHTSKTDPGIPYVTRPEKVSIGKYERKTVQYVYEMIEQDLVAGLPLINDQAYRTGDDDATGVTSYHFTSAAAHAFATRFYLFKKDYDKVIEHANAVFPQGDFSANLRPWNERYRSYPMNELITHYTKSTEKANLLLKETLSDWASTYNIQRYTTGLTRIREIVGANPTYGNYAFTIYNSAVQVYFVPKFREHIVRTGTNSNTGFVYTNISLFTAEEALLNRAEAYAMQNKLEESLADLNTLASKRIVDYDPTNHTLTANKLYNFYNESVNQRATLAAVLDFRRAEFLHEGLRWFDILRHNIPVQHVTRDGQTLELRSDDPRKVLQIPTEAITMGGIQPNPR
jgi:starch-binding outer membrane protein, SusD/RagB family